jgi:hypothetical protein
MHFKFDFPPHFSLDSPLHFSVFSSSHARRFYQRQHALDAVGCLNGATLDDMEIRCELDPGFQKGREFGYGLSGGQSVDDMRTKAHSERPRGDFIPLRNRAECAQLNTAVRLLAPPQSRSGTFERNNKWAPMAAKPKCAPLCLTHKPHIRIGFKPHIRIDFMQSTGSHV